MSERTREFLKWAYVGMYTLALIVVLCDLIFWRP